eukprot:6102594-Pyramimonas_sp.AAC.1
MKSRQKSSSSSLQLLRRLLKPDAPPSNMADMRWRGSCDADCIPVVCGIDVASLKEVEQSKQALKEELEAALKALGELKEEHSKKVEKAVCCPCHQHQHCSQHVDVPTSGFSNSLTVMFDATLYRPMLVAYGIQEMVAESALEEFEKSTATLQEALHRRELDVHSLNGQLEGMHVVRESQRGQIVNMKITTVRIQDARGELVPDWHQSLMR